MTTTQKEITLFAMLTVATCGITLVATGILFAGFKASEALRIRRQRRNLLATKRTLGRLFATEYAKDRHSYQVRHIHHEIPMVEINLASLA